MEDSQSRKARLKALRQEAEAQGQIDQPETQQGENDPVQQQEDAEPVLKLRNYEAKSKYVKYEKVDPAQPPEFEKPVLDQSKDDEQEENEEVITTLAPKKPTWDLKREIGKPLKLLDQQYHKTLYDLYHQEQQQRTKSSVKSSS